jgi:hypothetical protein
MRSEPEVLIVGAGPTGLTLAGGLLANGVAARVVDKAVAPAGTSRALGLQPRGIEVVDRLGALNDLPERALQVERIVVHINGKQAASVRVGQRTALVTRPSLTISQAIVEAALRRRVTELDGQIEWGQEVAAAEQDSHGVTVRFADGDQRRVGWLVGCDGAHSRVRELAGVGFPGVPLAERFLLVDAHADLPLSRRTIYVWLDADTVFGAFPLPGQDLSQLKVTYRHGPLGHQGRRWFSGRGPLPGDRVPDIECVRAEGGGHTTLHAELGNKWALVMPGPMVSDEYAAVVAKRLGDHAMIMLVADHDANREIMLVCPDAHLGWRGRAGPDALDRWLTAVVRQGRTD